MKGTAGIAAVAAALAATVKLETLFPGDASARNVNEPVYVGGPVLPRGVFALTRNAPDGAGTFLELMPGVVAVLDEATVDRIIETTPNGARYFVGLMRWEPDELEDQIHEGLWEVRPADAQTVLPARTPGLWNSLRSPMAGLGEREESEEDPSTDRDSVWLECNGELVDAGSVNIVRVRKSALLVEMVEFDCPRCNQRHESLRFR